jgi:hypothetical protein
MYRNGIFVAGGNRNLKHADTCTKDIGKQVRLLLGRKKV